MNSWNPNQLLQQNQLNCVRTILKSWFISKEIKFLIKNDQKSKNILTFLIKCDIFDLSMDFKVVFFNILIKNWSISINFNREDQNKIEIVIDDMIFVVRPKSTIEFGQLGIWIVDDLIPDS